ncbi:MAG: serine/threonine-protein kinase [Nannocystaceae bacterium]
MATRAGGSGSAWTIAEGGLVDAIAERRLRAMVHERLFGEPQPPVRIGRYRVQGRLGVGSMGTVYTAVDDELDRKVAIKLLHSHMVADPSVGHARLLREARALARLDHPNVVTIYEVGVHDGDVFLAMEHIEGETLGAWLASARRSAAAILDVMIAAGRGLAAAHDAGLVHRDIKPDNIIVDRRGRVRVVDFGLVRSVPRPGADGLTPLTGAEVILGTPAYMSPEQIRGEHLTAASDLYSFCMVLYEALFGERPVATQIAGGQAAGVAASAGRRAPRLRQILARGLERAPEARFASTRALLAELARIRRPPLRHEALVRILIAGAGVALALLVAILWLSERRAYAHELWRTRALVAALEVERELAVEVVGWSADGRLLRGRADGTIEVWRGAGEVSRRRCGDAPLVAVAASGGLVAAADRAREVCLWRGPEAAARRLSAGAAALSALAVDPVGGRVLVGDREGGVRALDLETGASGPRWAVGGHVLGLRILGDGAILAVTRGGDARVAELRGLELRERVRGR